MEPWQQAFWQDRREARIRAGLPLCCSCQRPVTSEWRLELERFGATGVVCEGCVFHALTSQQTEGAEVYE